MNARFRHSVLEDRGLDNVGIFMDVGSDLLCMHAGGWQAAMNRVSLYSFSACQNVSVEGDLHFCNAMVRWPSRAWL